VLEVSIVDKFQVGRVVTTSPPPRRRDRVIGVRDLCEGGVNGNIWVYSKI
jgi:hypothetical protein